MPQTPFIYDKAQYHLGEVRRAGLPDTQAYVHTAFYLRWIIENKLYSNDFREESEGDLERFERREITALDLYREWDGVFVDDMLSDDGNAFSRYYFDLEKADYIKDYSSILARGLPSIFHIEFNGMNYAKLKPRINRIYKKWQRIGPWWRLW